MDSRFLAERELRDLNGGIDSVTGKLKDFDSISSFHYINKEMKVFEKCIVDEIKHYVFNVMPSVEYESKGYHSSIKSRHCDDVYGALSNKYAFYNMSYADSQRGSHELSTAVIYYFSNFYTGDYKDES